MIEIETPPLPQRALELVADQTPVRGRPGPEPATGLAARVLLGGPVAVPVTADYVAGDPQLQLFVTAEAARSTFSVMQASVTFESAPGDPPLESAALGLRLFTTEAGETPIAWSMAPERAAHPVQTGTTWRLGPKLTISNVEASAGEWQHTTSRTVDEVFLEAVHLLRSDPEWRFRRTSAVQLAGAHRLAMVVRGPLRAEVWATVTVHAAIKGGVLLRYRTRELPPCQVFAGRLAP